MHGANRTGRPFTGDYAGVLLYETLHRFGFGSCAQSVSADDGLRLIDCRITNAVKCLPPNNKPVGAEINTCNSYLVAELELLPTGAIVVALDGGRGATGGGGGGAGGGAPDPPPDDGPGGGATYAGPSSAGRPKPASASNWSLRRWRSVSGRRPTARAAWPSRDGTTSGACPSTKPSRW